MADDLNFEMADDGFLDAQASLARTPVSPKEGWLEIRKYYQLSYGLTGVRARDACASKNPSSAISKSKSSAILHLFHPQD